MMNGDHNRRHSPATDMPRASLLRAVLSFVKAASSCPGVRRIDLIGSLTTPSKVLMRMPTLRSFGEGRVNGEAIDMCTHSIRRGSGHSTSER
jgi:hypothetical protein